MPAKRSFDAIGPRLLPPDAADRAHHMNLHGWHAHLQHPAAIGNGLRSQLSDRKAECLEGDEQTRRIVKGWSYENVDVTCKPWRAVEGKGISADDDELNAMGSQGRDELVEVGCELHRPVSGGIRQQQCVQRAGATTSSAERAASAPPRQRT